MDPTDRAAFSPLASRIPRASGSPAPGAPPSGSPGAVPPSLGSPGLGSPGVAEPKPVLDLGGLADAALVTLAVSSRVEENAAQARRLAAYAVVRDRCAADHRARRANARQVEFVMTPAEETAVEFGAAVRVSEEQVKSDLHVVDGLSHIFPRFWALCLAGRMEVGTAAVLLTAAESIADPADVARFAALMDAYLDRRDDPESPLVPFTRDQLQAAARYRKMKFAQKRPEEAFPAAFAKRHVRLDLHSGAGTGIGSLACSTAATDLMLADYRLTMIAKHRCQDDPEGRTVEQMRADTLVDLLQGRLTVGASTGDLEAVDHLDLDDDSHAATGDTEGDPEGARDGDRTDNPGGAATDGDAAAGCDRDRGRGRGLAAEVAASFRTHPLLGAWARSIINVTVPITSVMGLTDEPGLMSGDVVVPAELVRRIALDPGSTWYRMLTDEAGNMLDLSTKSYKPTAPIARATVARHRVCLWPTCSRPAVVCELDHRHPHPEGETCVDELAPFCKRHHRAKHADGFRLRLLEDGRYEFTTKRGTVSYARPSEQPVAHWPDAELIAESWPEGEVPPGELGEDLLDDLEADLAELDVWDDEVFVPQDPELDAALTRIAERLISN